MTSDRLPVGELGTADHGRDLVDARYCDVAYMPACAVRWLRRVLRPTGSAHGMELQGESGELGLDVEGARRTLQAWERAGWIVRRQFAPDLSQRALSIVHPSRRPTMEAAREAESTARKMGVDLYPTSHWWEPGPRAAEVLPTLPRAEGLQVGDRVRYSGHWRRSVGLTGDADAIRWRATVVTFKHGGKWALVELDRPVDCGACYGQEPAADCIRCAGTGTATLGLLAVGNLERAKT